MIVLNSPNFLFNLLAKLVDAIDNWFVYFLKSSESLTPNLNM